MEINNTDKIRQLEEKLENVLNRMNKFEALNDNKKVHRSELNSLNSDESDAKKKLVGSLKLEIERESYDNMKNESESLQVNFFGNFLPFMVHGDTSVTFFVNFFGNKATGYLKTIKI